MGKDDFLGIVADEVGKIIGAVGIGKMSLVGNDPTDKIIRSFRSEKHLRIMVGFEDVIGLPFDIGKILLRNESGVGQIYQRLFGIIHDKTNGVFGIVGKRNRSDSKAADPRLLKRTEQMTALQRSFHLGKRRKGSIDLSNRRIEDIAGMVGMVMRHKEGLDVRKTEAIGRKGVFHPSFRYSEIEKEDFPFRKDQSGIALRSA